MTFQSSTLTQEGPKIKVKKTERNIYIRRIGMAPGKMREKI